MLYSLEEILAASVFFSALLESLYEEIHCFNICTTCKEGRICPPFCQLGHIIQSKVSSFIVEKYC